MPINYSTPAGFRDVLAEEARIREKLISNVQRCFDDRGYDLIETPTLEVLEVMQASARTLAAPFKFFDSQGDLLAMRPDVTLQIARMCATRLKDQPGPFRFRYTQRVFRESETEMQAAARELTQMGIENIGESGFEADAELVGLLAEALGVCGLKSFTLGLATVEVFRDLLEKSGASEALQDEIVRAYHASNFVELDELLDSRSLLPEYAIALAALPKIRGGRSAIEQVRDLVEPLDCAQGLDSFEQTYSLLEKRGLAANLLVDFSIMSSFEYYTGIVVEAYSPGLGAPIGSGGRYDTMLQAYGQDRSASGFAFYLDRVMEALSTKTENSLEKPLRIAIPKGSLYADSVALLKQVGLDTTGLDDPGRHLIIRNPEVEYIIVRPTDAPIFVALGAADCGMCGKDSLLEADPDVVELVDLEYGACRFVVAEPVGAAQQAEDYYQKIGSIRIATKYPNITRQYYAKRGVQVEIVKLHGNIELAPLTGMAERIVDITATGTTLKENNLCVVDEVLSSTARFFANNSAFRTDARIIELAMALGKTVEE